MNSTQKPLVIYHGNCADGFTAAWVANRFFSGVDRPTGWAVDIFPGVYGEDPPDCTGRAVYILDFSYTPEVMINIAEKSKYTVWIDHHKTAIDAMGPYTHPKLTSHLSVDRSGAYLTAQRLFGADHDPEDIVKLVDDRDRWVFRDPRSKAFAAGMFSRHYTLEAWNALANDIDGTVAEGEAVLRKHWKDIHEKLDVMMVMADIAGETVPVANLSYMSASDACEEMLRRVPAAPFAVTWFLRKDGKRVFSLRSRTGSDVDVGAIAKKFGGGGHKHSAGFAVVEWPGGSS